MPKDVDDKVLVSVILPVYNGEKYLCSLLNTLVFQTLENIEIIIVNNGSTDNTANIIAEYQNKFPDKIINILVEHSERAGRGRNIGIKHARAKYIAFSDADDLWDYRGLEWLYNKAISNDYDLVFSPYIRVEGDRLRVCSTRNLKGKATSKDLIIGGSPSFWTKLVKKDLLLEVGSIPENFSAEDVAYTITLASYAKNIGYLEKPFYYYMNRVGSEVHTALSLKKIENIDAQMYCLEHGNRSCREYILYHIAMILRVNLRRDWVFADYFIKHLKLLWGELENNVYLKKNKEAYDYLKQYANLSNNTITNIYVNGFNNDIDDGFIRYIRENAFIGTECNVVVLNEKNCDFENIEVLRLAYKNKDYEFLGNYFALKYIYNNGGIYLDKNIVLEAPLNYLRYLNVFFGKISENEFSKWIYGGQAGNNVLKSILDTYENGRNYKEKLLPINERVKNILYIEYNIPISIKKTNIFKYNVSILGPDVICIPDTYNNINSLYPKLHLCYHNFVKYINNKDYFVINKETLNCLLEYNTSTNIDKTIINELRTELKNLKSSNSWKITRPLREIANKKYGKYLMYIYDFMKKVRRF